MGTKPNEDAQISHDRGVRYGTYKHMSQTAQELKALLLRGNNYNHEEREALELICTKLARIRHGQTNMQEDSWTDIIGYATLARASRRPVPVSYVDDPTLANPTHGNIDTNKDNL